MTQPPGDVDYVLPLRTTADDDLADLTRYLHGLTHLVSRVIVVDSSPPRHRSLHRRLWGDCVDIVDLPSVSSPNGKVQAVHAGISEASADFVVIADDDVRWHQEDLVAALASIQSADLLCPQNYFAPQPWHARWDTGRTLVNRAVGHDYPGTCIVRREAFLSVGGYDGGVLFENLELIRTFQVAALRVVHASSLFVQRRPPTTRKFLSQRVRQAYDDLAQPVKAVGLAAIAPVLTVFLLLNPGTAAVFAIGLVACVTVAAELGRRRHRGREVWSRTAALWAPVWAVERCCCIWAALAAGLRGGVWYAGHRLPVAAHSTAVIAARLHADDSTAWASSRSGLPTVGAGTWTP